MQNIIVKGRDNPVVFEFTFSGEFADEGLNVFDSLEVTIGNETYSTSNTDKIKVESATSLSLNIGDSTELNTGNYTPLIVGYSSIYDDGYELNGPNVSNLTDLKVR